MMTLIVALLAQTQTTAAAPAKDPNLAMGFAFIGVFLTFAMLLAYFWGVKRGSAAKGRHCPNCNSIQRGEYCANCGAKF